jgi:hypothetical protein
MHNNYLDHSQLSLAFSGHETFPLRQMWLKKVIDISVDGKIKKSKFSDPELIAALGVGKNMLSSMKYWALACQVIKDSSIQGCFDVTKLGHDIFSNNGLDPYTESPSTIWILHWKLTSNGQRSTTSYWIFNKINKGEFSKTELKLQLNALCKERFRHVSDSSITRDIDTIIRGYTPRTDQTAQEDSADPIFGELGLMTNDSHGKYRFNRGSKVSLNAYTFLYAVLDFWKPHKEQFSTLSLDSISYADGSPGRVFKLDENSIISYLLQFSELTKGKVMWSDSAGIKQISKKDFDFDSLMNEMLKKSYE